MKQMAVHLKIIVLDNHIQDSETPFTPGNKQMLMQCENASGLECDQVNVTTCGGVEVVV